METVSEDEARDLANRWIRRFESSILAQVNSGSEYDSTTTGTTLDKLSSSEETENGVILDYRPYESLEAEDYRQVLHSNHQNSGSFGERIGRSYISDEPRSSSLHSNHRDLELTNNTESIRDFDEKTTLIGSAINSKGNRPQTSTILCGSDSLGEETGSGVRGLQEGKIKTPRPDPEYLRKKRLQYFNPQAPKNESDSNVQLCSFSNISILDKNKNVLKTPECRKETKYSTGSWSKHREINIRDETDSESERKQWFGKMPTRPLSLKDEEDEFRLDLWGLKDAVLTGQVDLKSYLPMTSTSGSVLDHNCSLNGHGHTNGDENVSASLFATSIMADDSKSHKTRMDYGKFDRVTDNAYSIRKMEEEKLFGISGPGEEEVLNGIILNPSLENITQDINKGGKTRLKLGSAPEQQIKGQLYNGFENQSDSEGSLKNFTIKRSRIKQTDIIKGSRTYSDDNLCSSSLYASNLDASPVTARKSVINTLNSAAISNSLNHEDIRNKAKEKRGKEKILSELTEYMNTNTSPSTNVTNGNVTSGISSPRRSTLPIAISECKELKTSAQSFEENGKKFDRQFGSDSSDYEDQLKENIFLETPSKEPIRAGYLVCSSDMTSGVFNLDEDILLCGNKPVSLVENTPHEVRQGITTEIGALKAKVCPHCREVNSRAANWCIECGVALVKVKASLITAQQQAYYEKQGHATKNLNMETCDTNKKTLCFLSRSVPDTKKVYEEQKHLQNCIENLSIQATCSESFDDDKYSSSPVGYKRRWLKSSTAWSTFNPNELSKPSSLDGTCKVEFNKNKKIPTNLDDSEVRKTRSSSDLSALYKNGQVTNSKNSRGRSASRRRTLSGGSSHGGADVQRPKKVKNQKSSKSLQTRSTKSTAGDGKSDVDICKRKGSVSSRRPHSAASRRGNCWTDGTTPKGGCCPKQDWKPRGLPTNRAIVPPLDLSDLASYDHILTLIRSQRGSEPLPYLCLPDEVMLQIFCYLTHKDLASCAKVCKQFYRIASDETLWKVIVLRKCERICDDWLFNIGERHPVCLTISHCHGTAVSSVGLRHLFRSCSASLQELDFSGCNSGELIGESILLHVAARCAGLKSVDASWSNVSDSGVQALAEQVERLECLCLNGCQAITDASLKCVARKHGESLRILEVFGCFNITPAGLSLIGKSCTHLETLNIGQCYKITDSAIGSLVSVQTDLENLDLRGCKQTRDASVKKIVRHCPHLTSLVLANCPLITNISLAEIATNLPRIRTLDFCGCANVTDVGVRALAKCCQSLEVLDLSSTGITNKSVDALANYCSRSLTSLKLSFCLDITDTTVNHLAKHCKRLATLHLYGCKRIRNTQAVKYVNEALHIER